MSNARESFDAIGIVIDWIDACKQRRLDDLLDLYDDTATVECCEGGRFQGRAAMKWYWGSKARGVRSRCVRGRSIDARGRLCFARLSRV